MLRCRKGDMAIVLRSAESREGFVVDVGDFAGKVDLLNGKYMSQAWRVFHKSHDEGVQYFSEDCDLLPIRPGGLDETEETEKELTNAE